MALKSILRPEHSVQIGVLVGIVDLFIYDKGLPPLADVRTASPANNDVEQSRKQAAWTSIAFNSFVSLITRDWNVFLIGGIVVATMDFMYKHANEVNPATGKTGNAGQVSDAGQMNSYPMPDYSMQS